MSITDDLARLSGALDTDQQVVIESAIYEIEHLRDALKKIKDGWSMTEMQMQQVANQALTQRGSSG